MERRDFGMFTKILGHMRSEGRCECTGCSSCGYGSRCATTFGLENEPEYDHRIRRDDDSLENLAMLCTRCHREKSGAAPSIAALLLGSPVSAETTAQANAHVTALSALLNPRPKPDPYYGELLRLLATQVVPPQVVPPAADWLSKLGVPPPKRQP